jgi:hypothetical protein
VEVVPGVGAKATSLAVAEIKVQPIVCYLFYGLPTSSCIFGEWTGAAPWKSDLENPVLEAVAIPEHTLR